MGAILSPWQRLRRGASLPALPPNKIGLFCDFISLSLQVGFKRNFYQLLASIKYLDVSFLHSVTLSQRSLLHEHVLSCWVVMIIPIPLPQHQHTFCQRRRFDQDCPGLRQVEMNNMKST